MQKILDAILEEEKEKDWVYRKVWVKTRKALDNK